MNGYQKIKRQLLPLIKGMPFVIVIFLLALYISNKIITYSPNVYQTMAKIKLDDQKFGFSNTTLYKDFDVFSTENKTEAEAEILKSPLIIGRAIDSVDMNVTLYRIGQIKNTMVFGDDSPILITYQGNKNLLDKPFELTIKANDKVIIQNGGEKTTGLLNDSLAVQGGKIYIKKHNTSSNVKLEGRYQFTIHSRDALIASISDKLDVKAVDKEIPVLRVVYKDEHPEKTAVLVNAICKAYIEDYVCFRSQAAKQTVSFIDNKIEEVSIKLRNSENNLERYKRNNNVVNTLQETETGLRQISNLKIQLINLEMNEEAIIKLEEYVNSGDYFDETAISFGFGDLLLTELAKKLKLWNDEKLDLLTKYTSDHEKVLAVEAKIEEIKGYVKTALARNKSEIITKREDIQTSLDEASHQFDDLPTREKEMQILDREFRLQESIYNFLTQKRIDAAIASTAAISFHRIIQPAVVPTEPISPNRVLIKFIGGLLGLILGIAFVYLKKMVRGKATGREDLEKHSELPVLGVVRRKNTDEDFISIAKTMVLKEVITPGTAIAIASTLTEEGKTYVCFHLGQAFAKMGYSVCSLDMNGFNPELRSKNGESIQLSTIDKDFEANPGSLISVQTKMLNPHQFAEKLEILKTQFDFVLIDTPATAVSIEGVELMKLADASVYITKADHTTVNYLDHADLLVEEYNLENVHLLLNNAHKASNYSGTYLGSSFSYKKKSGLKRRLRYVYNTYMK